MNMRVVIATRDDWLRVTVRSHLQRQGYQVDTAHDGVECLEKLEDRPPDILVLEYDLLWGNADGVLACLREHTHPRPLPVILILNDNAAEVPAELLTAPVVACFRKPFEHGDLTDCLLSLSAWHAEAATQRGDQH